MMITPQPKIDKHGLSRSIIFTFLSFILIGMMPCHIRAQVKGDYNWIGGIQRNNVEGGRMGFNYNFNKKPPEAEYVPLKYGFDRNIASISDEQCELLFYTNGCAVMNRYHEVMPNGDSINAGRYFETFWRGDCNYGYPGLQDIIILPDPNYDKGYYILDKARMIYDHSTQDSIEMRYSYVDMDLDQGRGDVTLKNIRYYNKEDVLWSFLTAISHSNQKDWWIVQPLKEQSKIAVFIIDEKGPHLHSILNSNQYLIPITQVLEAKHILVQMALNTPYTLM